LNSSAACDGDDILLGPSSSRKCRMTNVEARNNDEVRMTKGEQPCFDSHIPDSFVIRASSSCPDSFT
jgi:hypothetical protein